MLFLGCSSLSVAVICHTALIGSIDFELRLSLGILGISSLGLCRIGLGNSAVSLGSLAVCISQTSVYLCQIRNNLVRIVCLPELQVCTTLKQLTHTLRLTDTRHFNHDTSLLSLELLDVGLNDAELVDTSADNVE